MDSGAEKGNARNTERSRGVKEDTVRGDLKKKFH